MHTFEGKEKKKNKKVITKNLTSAYNDVKKFGVYGSRHAFT